MVPSLLPQPWRKRLLTAAAISPLVALWVMADRHERRELSEAELSAARSSLDRLTTTAAPVHASNLSVYGATVIRQLLNDEAIKIWKHRTRESFSKAVNVQGRFHYNVARSSPHHTELAALGGETWHKGRRRPEEEKSSALSPLTAVVDAYFRKIGVRRYTLTQLQFLNVIPGSTHQIWHKDNTEPGLTVLIALRDVGTNGPTELLLRSHNTDVLDCCAQALRMDDVPFGNSTAVSSDNSTEQHPCCQHLMGCLMEGDALLYDSRLLHRGRGYNLAQMDRPVLVLRWDAAETPPPGSGLIKTTATRILGSWLSTLIYARTTALATLFGTQQARGGEPEDPSDQSR